MDNITQLWIRACKSENSKQRLRSVYLRFYCTIENKEQVDIIIANLLIGIVDQYYPMTTSEWCREMECFYRESLTYEEKKHSVLVSRLTWTPRDKLIGMKTPRRFKKGI